jgi:predicted phage terminase large subunit-like protein
MQNEIIDPRDIFSAEEPLHAQDLSYSDRQRMEQILKDGWRLTPATMAVKITEGRWIPAKHLLYISTIVATEIAKGGARIILTMPFRHGKSEFLSINTPIWFLEKWPEKYVMNLTYGAELATDFSARVRDTFMNPDLHHLLRTRLNNKKLRVDRFLTTSGGGLTAAGIGGPITGRGADLMLIDDYIKNHEEALSVAGHKKVFEWFKSTAYTRLEPGGSLIVLATRWDYKDLIARLITELPHENWKVINLPMFAMVNDPLGRVPGEVLWPERYPLEACQRIEKTLGPYWFAAQCQQDPKQSMAGADLGNKVKLIDEKDLPPLSELKTIRAWDLAAGDAEGDWSVGFKMARHAPTRRLYILDIQRHQNSSHKNKLLIHACAQADGHGVKVWMEQEPGSSGKTVITDYKELLKTYSFEGERASGPIEVRAGPGTAAIEAGNVYMIRAPWNETFIEELNGFPDGEWDDQVIAFALCYNKLLFGIKGALTWGREEVPADNVIPIRSARADYTKPQRRLTW